MASYFPEAGNTNGSNAGMCSDLVGPFSYYFTIFPTTRTTGRHLKFERYYNSRTSSWGVLGPTSFPGPTPLSKWPTGAEKTLVYAGRPPAKYSKNRGVFCHVTFDEMSSSLQLISSSTNQNGNEI